MKVLKSYTTRVRRENETEEDSDHIFIHSDEVEKITAKFKRPGKI